MSRLYKFIALMLLVSSSVFAQYTISGKVTSAQTGENLIGANVILKSTAMGAATDENGNFSFAAPAGKYTIAASFIGFEKQEVEINLTNNMVIDFQLKDFQFSMSVTVIADRAREFETPVAFTDIDKKEMEQVLGSRDIPMVLNTSPSVYATLGGGGAGDGRFNVRGFDQRNVAVMINGVPVNDMEWGWVYWSNWDGVGDAAGSIQLQRGLSATLLSTPSIGGSMNLLSEPTSQTFGIRLKQEFGTNKFLKTALSASSGLIDGKWAFNLNVVRKTGDGLADKAWTDAWAYYFGAAYNINNNHRIELYALGAPQRHGQRRYALNIGNYDHDFALGLKGPKGYDPDALLTTDNPTGKFRELGLSYNPNWNVLNPDFDLGDEYWNGGTHERYATDYLNEIENYFHKPQVNLNWYGKFTDSFSLYTTLYYSGGLGGGTGTLGNIRYDYTNYQRIPDWNATIQNNINDGTKGSRAILRNSVNNQWSIGAISKAIFQVNENISAQFGVDWRTGKVFHFREVRNLLGNDFIDLSRPYSETRISSKSDFWVGDDFIRRLGDKIDYDFENTIDWLGFFGQAEYTSEKMSMFGIVGWNMKKYTYLNHFLDDGSGNELTSESDNLSGYQVKAGMSYRLTKNIMVYANGGYVSSVPIFDNVINDRTGFVITDTENELFISAEGGLEYHTSTFGAKVGYYYTQWKDRATTETARVTQDTEGMILISGMDQQHTGLEYEFHYQPVEFFRLDVAGWFGDWYFTDDVYATYKDYSGGGAQDVEFNAYVKDLKVGDMPQTGLAVTLSVMPIRGMRAALQFNTYRDHYAKWEPFDRTNPNDREQSWKIPAYSVADFHFNYDLPFEFSGVGIQVFAHVFNLFDEIYISDATDNSSYNAYTANGKNHSADDAEVYMGLERYYNFGIRINY